MFPYLLKFGWDNNILPILNLTRLRFRVTTFKLTITMAVVTGCLLVLFPTRLFYYFLSHYIPVLFSEILGFSLLKKLRNLEFSFLNQFVFDAFFKRTANFVSILSQYLDELHRITWEEVEFVSFNNASKKDALPFLLLVWAFIYWSTTRFSCCLDIV